MMEQALREQEYAALFVEAGIANEQQVAALVEQTLEHFGLVDALCNNAGIEIYRRAHEYTIAEWNLIHNVNLRGAFLCSNRYFSALEWGQGSIVNISSSTAAANITSASFIVDGGLLSRLAI